MFLSRESGGFEESIDGYNSFRSPWVNPTCTTVCTQSSGGYSSPVISHPSSVCPCSESTTASQVYSQGGQSCIKRRFTQVGSVCFHTVRQSWLDKASCGALSSASRQFVLLAAALKFKQGLWWQTAPVCIGSPAMFHSQHACSSSVFTPLQSRHHTMHLLSPRRGIRGTSSAQRCSPSRLVTVVLLFAEIHGGSKTKQGAPATNGPLRWKTPTAARQRGGQLV